METVNPAKVVTTRKEHLCNACHRRMPKGSKMKTSVNADQGEIWTWRTCQTCTILLDEFRDLFIDEVEHVFWDGCVRDMPMNVWGKDRQERFAKDPTPEHMLEILREDQS